MMDELSERRRISAMVRGLTKDQRFHGLIGWVSEKLKEGYWAHEISQVIEKLQAMENDQGKVVAHVFPYMERMMETERRRVRERAEYAAKQRALDEEREAARKLLGTNHPKLRMIYDFLDGKMSREEYLDWMWKMHTQEPEIGWDAASKNLERFYERRHLL